MVIAFIPFPTHVLAEHLDGDQAQTATVFYGLTNVAMAAMFTLLWFYAIRGDRLLGPEPDRRVVTGISRSFRPGVPLYVLATLSAFVSSWLAVVLFAGLALFYVVESSLFGRDG
jgi:uncharacterized membrane protein